jgi:hypothetical protein
MADVFFICIPIAMKSTSSRPSPISLSLSLSLSLPLSLFLFIFSLLNFGLFAEKLWGKVCQTQLLNQAHPARPHLLR